MEIENNTTDDNQNDGDLSKTVSYNPSREGSKESRTRGGGGAQQPVALSCNNPRVIRKDRIVVVKNT